MSLTLLYNYNTLNETSMKANNFQSKGKNICLFIEADYFYLIDLDYFHFLFCI